jgi:hypothetical protein
MPPPASLGLLPEIWKLIFEKSRRLARWDSRLAQMDALLRQSRAMWIDEYSASPVDPHPIIAQRAIFFACRFKMMEITKLHTQEETDVALYVYDLSTRSYAYMDDIEMTTMFEDHHSEDEEEFLQEEEDVP